MPSIVVPCRTMEPIASALSSRMLSRLFRVIPAARGRSSLATLGIGTSANSCPSAAHSRVVSSPMPTSTQRSATPSVSKARRNEPPTMSSEPGTSREGNLSTSSTSMPARRSVIALLRPAGPAPTISTFETAPIAPPNKGWATLRSRRSRRLVPPVSVERRPGNSECLADFTDGSALVFGEHPQLVNLAGTQGLGSAEQPATCSSGGQAGVGPLPDEVPLKLSEGAKDMEDELPAAGRGVDLLLQRPEADAPLLQLPAGHRRSFAAAGTGERGGTHGRDGGQDIEWAWSHKLLCSHSARPVVPSEHRGRTGRPVIFQTVPRRVQWRLSTDAPTGVGAGL